MHDTSLPNPSPLFQIVLEFVTLVQLFVLVGEAHDPASDHYQRNIAAAHVEDISFADDDVGILAGFNRTGAVCNAQYFSGIQGDG